jgi:hypothetical protein
MTPLLYGRAFCRKFPETFVYRYITGTAIDVYHIVLATGRVLSRVPEYVRDHYNESDQPLWWRILPHGLKKFILDVEMEKISMQNTPRNEKSE